MNDIALVKLRKDVTLGKFVRTVCIPRKDESDFAVTSKYGIVTGWGATMALKSGQEPNQAKLYMEKFFNTLLSRFNKTKFAPTAHRCLITRQ